MLAAFLLFALSVSACGLGQQGRSNDHGTPAGGAATSATFIHDGWKTNFSKHSVPLNEITSGGPPRDGIPPIDHPKFTSIGDANGWLKPKEPVIQLSIGVDHRAYPLQILIWHEITNDVVGGVPVAVTFCPLCDTAIVFDRRLDGQMLDFGTTGNVRNSDLVMWDRETESWWQQVGGDAIVGELTGKHLIVLPASILSWAGFREAFPNGRVLSRDTGFSRPYGENPYVGYDDAGSPPFLYSGKLDGRLQPKERVVLVSLAGEVVAYPFTVLTNRRVIADTVSGQPIVVFFQPGTASALDASDIGSSKDVGSTGVFRPTVDGRVLTFSWSGGAFIDAQTASHWSLLGQAMSGPQAGKQLEPVVHTDSFWFAVAAFNPKTRIYR